MGDHAACIEACDWVISSLEKARDADLAAGGHGNLPSAQGLFAKALFRRSTARAKTGMFAPRESHLYHELAKAARARTARQWRSARGCLHAGDPAAAMADCRQSLKHDPTNAHGAALLAELEGHRAPQDALSIRQRAAARFKAGHYSAAADAYRLLAALPLASTSEQAAASSSLALCLYHQGQHDASLAACDAALERLVGCRWPQARPASQDVASRIPACDGPVLVKTFARVAANLMHQRKYKDAAHAYGAAADVAASLGQGNAVTALRADAAHAERQASEQGAGGTHALLHHAPRPAHVGCA